MTKKLNQEAVDEITNLLNEVKDVARLVGEMGIKFQSFSWTAVFPINHEYENILGWNKKDFEKLDISNINGFDIGGCVTTYEHKYKDSYIIEPQELAEAKSKTVQKYLKAIIDSSNLKYFDLELNIPYKISDNGGWEHFVGIQATIKESAINKKVTVKDICEGYTDNKDKHLDKEILINTGEEIAKIDWINIYEDKIIISLKR